MSSIRYQPKRVFQPQDAAEVDWSNPLTRGLVDVIDLSGFPRSLVLRTPAQFFGTTPAFGRPTAQGRGQDSSAAFGSCFFQRSDGLYAPAAQTHIALASFDAIAGSGFDGVFTTANGDGSSASAQTYFGSATQLFGPGLGSNAPEARDNLGVLAVSYAADAVSLWWNGRLNTKNAGTTLPTFSTSRLILNGARNTSPGFATRGRYVLHLMYSRGLSDDEIRTLSANPWQLFRPRTLYIPTAAAGGGTHDTTGALAGAGATTAGSAAHIAVHGSSGVLAGAGASTTGAAARTRVHPSSGVLAGGGAVIAGAADHAVPGGAHDTTGALTGGGATVAGTAAHIAKHATTGALTGGGAAIAGTAAHQVTHATSGALAGGGAQISGSAVGAGGSVSAGGDDDTKPRKRRYIVQDGKRLLVFDNRAEAIEAERAIEQAREAARKAIANAQTKTQAKKTAKRAAQAVSKALDAALLAPPAEVVSLDAIQASVAPYPQAMAALQSAMQLRDAEAMYRAWQDMRDDEEDIAAILELM